MKMDNFPLFYTACFAVLVRVSTADQLILTTTQAVFELEVHDNVLPFTGFATSRAWVSMNMYLQYPPSSDQPTNVVYRANSAFCLQTTLEILIPGNDDNGGCNP